MVGVFRGNPNHTGEPLARAPCPLCGAWIETYGSHLVPRYRRRSLRYHLRGVAYDHATFRHADLSQRETSLLADAVVDLAGLP